MTKSTGPALIGILDDEEAVTSLIVKTLQNYGFDARSYHDPSTFLVEFETLKHDLVILDLGLPELDGLTLVPQLRKMSPDLAIIILSGRSADADRIVGLELGADDYIGKPFNPRELVARTKSVLRRTNRPVMQKSQRRIALFGGLKYDIRTFGLTYDGGEEIMLGTAEARLLEAFLMAPNRILTRDYLLDAAGRENSLDRAVDVNVSRLRKHLQEQSSGPPIIRTVYGAGYMLTKPVQWQDTTE
ncbi:response regulator transcription factor [Rhodospirillaceae bacterium KN72]|uniref:Response regulator transcription factor n=1 Tax=Pacificispira spongiicola TaxID=2729598 RepID=A0A7Y0DYH0_9PROT|nr:response regulator transcription factor [Pacificispira spongiicola]NMM43937.1 response regulator transcription factor [Pacificispira spongiicola]